MCTCVYVYVILYYSVATARRNLQASSLGLRVIVQSNKFYWTYYEVTKQTFAMFVFCETHSYDFYYVTFNHELCKCCSTVHELPFWLITFWNNDLRLIEKSWQQTIL